MFETKSPLFFLVVLSLTTGGCSAPAGAETFTEEFYFLWSQLTQDYSTMCQQVVEHYYHVFVYVLLL